MRRCKMSYRKIEHWQIIPTQMPVVMKNCSKCGEKTHFINSKKFRVNANGKSIDVWLIYNCEHCKTNWNMTIHERIHPKSLDESTYEKYLANDEDLAEKIGFDRTLHAKNKSELIFLSDSYDVLIESPDERSIATDERSIVADEPTNTTLLGHLIERDVTIKCDFAVDVRMDRLIADTLKISRSEVKKRVFDERFLKSKVKNGITFCYK